MVIGARRSLEMESPETAASAVTSADLRLLFRAHVPAVYGYLLHRLGGRTAVAEELTRTVFSTHVGSGQSEEPDEGADEVAVDDIGLRLQLLAREQLVMFLERAAKKPDLVLGPADIDGVATSDTERDTLGFLEGLPSEQRLAVTLRHVDDLPLALVADAMGSSVKAAESSLAAVRPRPIDGPRLAALDKPAEPDPGFTDELEDRLVELAEPDSPLRAAASPSPAGMDAPRDESSKRRPANRFAPNQTPRIALAALLVLAVVAIVWKTNGGDTDRRTETDGAAPPSTPTTATTTTARPTTSAPESTPPSSGSTTTTEAATDETATDKPANSSTSTTTTAAERTAGPRKPSDPAYLDRGPLSPRSRHDTIWTGAEMIVWGGAELDNESDRLTDGAAFDPRLNTWRSLSAAPFDNGVATTALWAGDQTIVVSADATLAYRHWLDDWLPLGDGIDPGPAIWTGTQVVLANGDGISMFDPESGTWAAMPDPGIRQFRDEDGEARRMVDRFEFGLHMLDGDLYFVRGCGPNIWRWTGETWSATARPRFDDLTGPSNVIFCAWANQTAVVDDRILVWSDDEHPSIIYDPRSDAWEEVETPPLPSTEGPAGGLTMGTRVLAINWSAAIYDVTTGEWATVALPGEVFDSGNIVWTGDELLAWNADDAWRIDQ